MKNIVYFDSLKDFIVFLYKKGCTSRQIIGEGAEGKCFLSSVDGCAYKIITNTDIDGNYFCFYDINKVITSQDFNLKHYVLPDELYVVDNGLVGYKTRYIKEKNIFDESRRQEIIKQLCNLKESVLIEAYYKILNETDLLSSERIDIYDLTHNLMFTGSDYYGIDTCGYEKIDESVLMSNREYLDISIKENFDSLLFKSKLYSEKPLLELYEIEDMEEYSKKLIKLIKR